MNIRIHVERWVKLAMMGVTLVLSLVAGSCIDNYWFWSQPFWIRLTTITAIVIPIVLLGNWSTTKIIRTIQKNYIKHG